MFVISFNFAIPADLLCRRYYTCLYAARLFRLAYTFRIFNPSARCFHFRIVCQPEEAWAMTPELFARTRSHPDFSSAGVACSTWAMMAVSPMSCFCHRNCHHISVQVSSQCHRTAHTLASAGPGARACLPVQLLLCACSSWQGSGLEARRAHTRALASRL